MSEFRKSPLTRNALAEAPIKLRENDLSDIGLMTQHLKLSDKTTPTLDFWKFIGGNKSPARRMNTYRIANAVKQKLDDKGSHDTIYNGYSSFVVYFDYCECKGKEPFSLTGYRSYLGRNGELVRLVNLARTPLDYLYLYKNGDEVGLNSSSASYRAGYIRQYLTAAGMYEPLWDRDLPKFESNPNPTKAYRQNEYKILLRRLQFVFFSLSSQLIAAKNNGEGLPHVSVVIDELDNGEVLSVELGINNKANIGEVIYQSPFNMAMISAFYLFCHYSNFNSSSIVDLCHPIEFDSHRDKKLNRTTRFANIKAWKSRSKKVVEGTFSEEPGKLEENITTIEIDKRDGLAFIHALNELSTLYYPSSKQEHHSPLFFNLGVDRQFKNFNLRQSTSNLIKILNIYSDKKILHTDYLIERFREVLHTKELTEMFERDGIVVKKVNKVGPREYRRTLTRLAYAVIRSLTNIELKGMYMPLSYSKVNDKGSVKVSFKYNNGKQGSFNIQNLFVSFFYELESYSRGVNDYVPAKNHPNQKLSPFLLPLGKRNNTYQWKEEELYIRPILKKIGIYLGDYLLDINAMRIRATASNNNINPDDGGLEVATSLLQNTVETLQKHYVDGEPTQNQVIANQAIEVLEEITKGASLEEAKSIVMNSRNIDVLEYDEWKALRQPTNINGILCDGKPSGKAKKEHRASQKASESILGQNAEISCYQYDMCTGCNSAKLVDDVNSVYKLLSYVELLEESSSSFPERQLELSEKAEELLLLAETNISDSVFEMAEDKLAIEGRYFLHNSNYLNSMETVIYNA
ncbi:MULTISPECIES: hypothetical protein [unclassified Colwellia]|jgi:hypothetical protein|uniref:hypothetical protein n=1 Tax=unclassified Colwellia TaxID=196834 RepID=UPI0015F4D039|nr:MULTISPECIES: hypothetical protein [unclassified Colwellia]MBA6256468.1 hypothetical protein [Colwellia sp. MB3u-28]MBA6260329.1 hypothetical protein [Colwellia sp. MB3u-41]